MKTKAKNTDQDSLENGAARGRLDTLVVPLLGGIQINKCNKCGGVIDHFLYGFGGCNNCDTWTKDYTVERASHFVTDVA